MNISIILESLFLGVVQGLTEFIPVSSSGHLQIIPNLFGWQPSTTTFLLMSQIGTLLALLIYFRHDLKDFAVAIWDLISHQFVIPAHSKSGTNIRLMMLVVLATIPAGAIGYVLESQIDSFYTSSDLGTLPTAITALAMILMGLLFLVAEKIFTGKKIELLKLTPFKAILIGTMQALALIRGVSRSGITILAGGAVGLTKPAAARFSFLMSIPILGASSLLGVINAIQQANTVGNEELIKGTIGLVAAFISGLLVINPLLNYLKHHGLANFAWYRIIFGVVTLIILLA